MRRSTLMFFATAAALATLTRAQALPSAPPTASPCAGAPVAFTTPSLDVARGDWLQATLDIIEQTTEAVPHPNFSADEWKCQIAEHQFGTEAQRTCGYGNSSWAEAHAERIRWAEDVVFFYCLAEPFAEVYDYHHHKRLRERHVTQRFTWQPNHMLPGETRKAKYRFCDNKVGLVHEWTNVKELQDLRVSLMPKFIARDEAVVMMVARDAEEAKQGRVYLRSREMYGDSMFPIFWQGKGQNPTPPGYDVHYMMRLLRGFRSEAYLYADAGMDAPPSFARHEIKALMDVGRLPQTALYEEDKLFGHVIRK